MNRKEVFRGRIFDVVSETVTLPNGKTVVRELVLHPGAAVILALPRRDVLLMLVQYRHAVGDEIYELPAGTLEEGESLRACAARELVEETGYRAGSLRPLTEFWSSPGILRERMHLFLAEDLDPAEGRTDEDEVLRCIEMPLAEALEHVRAGRIVDAKTIVGILYYDAFGEGA